MGIPEIGMGITMVGVQLLGMGIPIVGIGITFPGNGHFYSCLEWKFLFLGTEISIPVWNGNF